MFYIATPSWNYGRYLSDAILSVSSQCSHRTIEHHIQDGASTDETAAVLQRRTWSGLRWTSEADGGQCDALNRAISKAPPDARYYGWLNADEYYLPHAFDLVDAVFSRFPDVDVVFGDCVHVDNNGKVVRLVAQHKFSRFTLRHYGTFIQTASTFYRRRLVDHGLVRLDSNFKQAMDFELFVRLDEAGAKFKHIAVPLSCFRLHDDQLTKKNGPEIERIEHERVEKRLGYVRRRKLGRYMHRLHKVCNGAYVREIKFLRRRGDSTRWFVSS